MTAGPDRWRILVIRGRSPSSEENLIPSTDVAEELKDAPGVQVKVLNTPKLTDIKEALESFKPNIVYAWAGCSGFPDAGTSKLQHLVVSTADGASVERVSPDDLVALVKTASLHALVLNVHLESLLSIDFKSAATHVVHWTPGHEVAAVNGALFALALLGFLRQPHATFVEAFAVAVHLLRAHGTNDSALNQEPIFPVLLSDELPELPGCKPLRPPYVEGLDLSQGLARSVPGWETTRLLSPVAEVTLALVALPSVLETERLAALGLALRAFLALELTGLAVQSSSAVGHAPAHVVPGSEVARLGVRTQSGVTFSVVLGAPPQVMQTPALLEAALKATLTCDAISLRFQLPPQGAPPPEATASPAVARGCRTTHVLLATSVWVAHVLRALAKRSNDRFLPLLGVGAVGTQPTASFLHDDAARFALLESQQPALLSVPQVSYARLNKIGGPPPAVLDANLYAAALRARGEIRKLAKKAPPPAADPPPAATPEVKPEEAPRGAEAVEQWSSSRPALAACTPQQFLDDLMDFLADRQGWKGIERARFPDAVLNGTPLDLWNLYREVVTRGGFKVGNAINWKGQVFTKMRNWTTTHKMTGVANALKRHYQTFLYEYERANQRDVGKGNAA